MDKIDFKNYTKMETEFEAWVKIRNIRNSKSLYINNTDRGQIEVRERLDRDPIVDVTSISPISDTGAPDGVRRKMGNLGNSRYIINIG